MEWLLCYKFDKTGFRHNKKHLLCLTLFYQIYSRATTPYFSLIQKGLSMNHPELHFITIDQDPKKFIFEGEKVVSALFCAYHL